MLTLMDDQAVTTAFYPWLTRRVVCLCALLLTLVPVFSAEETFEEAKDQPWQIQSFASAAKLENQRIFDIAFAPGNVIWFAASSGLYSYDGYVWTRHGREQGLPDDYVRTVCLTRSGDLWIGTASGGGIYHPKEHRFDPADTEAHLPNKCIRSITEEASGDLWFCCDQWPNAAVKPGGLAVRHADGKWEVFTTSEGLPMNYVVSRHRDPSGKEWAFTPQGWVWKNGNQWQSVPREDLSVEPSLLEMVETEDGATIAQGETHSMIRRNGDWEELPDQIVALGGSSQGTVALIRDNDRERVWFSVWEDGHFVARSARILTSIRSRFYRLREAPDGALWCVGYGAILRWQRSGGLSEFYPQLPRPVLFDAQGRLWFSGANRVAWKDSSGIHPLRVIDMLIGIDKDGAVIGSETESGLIAQTSTEHPEVATPLDTSGIHKFLRMCKAHDGTLWILGSRADGQLVICHRQGGVVRHVLLPGDNITKVQSMEGDPAGGILLSTFGGGAINCRVAKISDDDEFTWIDLGPDCPKIPYPHYTRALGQEWLMAHGSVVTRPIGKKEPWTRFPDVKAWGYSSYTTGNNEVVITFEGGPGVESGCMLYSDGKWQVKYGSYFVAFFSNDNRRLFLTGPGGVFVRPEPGNLDMAFLPIPGASVPHTVVEEADHSLWVGTVDGTLHLRPQSMPPLATVSSPAPEIDFEGTLAVTLGGQSYLLRNRDVRAFQFSWSIDQNAWSSYQAGPDIQIRTKGFPPGRHELKVLARDSYGNISREPAVLVFQVRDLPLQRQVWFLIAVALAAFAIVFLIILGAVRTRQIARANAALEAHRKELEQRVEARTAELKQANESLKKEISDREQAEASKQILEEQLRHSQKLQAIGTLAGGIAHDFNNILTIIIPNVDMVLQDYGDQKELRGFLEPVLRAAERARDLVKQILTFSRQQKQARDVIDVAACVRDASRMIRAGLPSAVQFEMYLAHGPLLAKADANQIQQVLINLCTNSEHALEGRAGTIRVSLGPTEPDESTLHVHPEARGQRYLLLSVTDSGAGMSPEVVQRIFEPFYTTKRPGRGTGLGLSVVHGIIRDHGGFIEVSSAPAQGTTFRIYLPSPSDLQLAPKQEEAAATTMGNGIQVLLVDDEPLVLDVTQRILERFQFKVSGFEDPIAALRVFKANPKAFSVVVTDLSMPGMSGMELGRAVHETNPDTPVILITGFDASYDRSLFGECGISLQVNKPINALQFARLIQSVAR